MHFWTKYDHSKTRFLAADKFENRHILKLLAYFIMLNLRRQVVAADNYRLIKSKMMFILLIFLNCSHNGAMRYFDRDIGPDVGLAYLG